MQRMWNELVSFFQGTEQDGAYWGIGLLAVLFCLIHGGRERKYRQLVAGAMCVVVVFLLNPVTACLYERIFGVAYPISLASLAVPLLPFISYAGTMLIAGNVEGRPLRDRVVLVAGVALIIMAAGTMVPLGGVKRADQGDVVVDVADERCMNAVLDAAKELQGAGQEPLLIAPKEIMENIRRYDGGIRLIYGRDLWQTDALTYLHEAYPEDIVILCQRMESADVNVAQTVEMALSYGCNLVVCKEMLSDEFMEYRHLELYYEEQGLYMYVRR